MGAPGWTPARAQDAPAGAAQGAGETAQTPASAYGGPSILSRGNAPSVMRGGETARLVPFLSATGSYDSGMGGTTVNPQGQTVYAGSYGVEGDFGITGAHTWEHSVLDLAYRGVYRDYTNEGSYNGLDNSLDIGFHHQLTSRLGIVLGEDFARTRSSFSLPMAGLYESGTGGFNPIYNALTAENVLATPTLASVSDVRLVYQHTARLSVSVGATGIVSRQHAQETLGVNGYVASADVAYRLSRYQTIDFNYSYSHFGYLGQLGDTGIHGAGIGYSARLGRYWEASLSGGASRVESLRSVAVTLDPVLAQLLGESVVFAQSRSVFYTPYGAAHLTRSFRHSFWSAGYNRSVVSGNGLYTTSNYEAADTSYFYGGLRRLSLQAGAGFGRTSAITQSLGRSLSYHASAGFGFGITKGFSLVGRIDGYRYSVAGSGLDRTTYRAGMGIAWNPGQYPVALW